MILPLAAALLRTCGGYGCRNGFHGCKALHAKPVNLTQEEYTAMSKELDELAQTLLKGSEQDTEAYCMIKDAFALPKSTDEEKEVRKQAVRDAAYQAALVPKNNGYNNKRVYELVCRLEGSSNPACLSDLMSAKYRRNRE